jgi:hypothetical protein
MQEHSDTKTETTNTVTLPEFIKYFETKDPHYLTRAKQHLSRCIEEYPDTKRMVTPDMIIEMCKLSEEERIKECERIYNLELIDIVLYKFPFLEKDRKKLSTYESLKQAFKDLYVHTDFYDDLEKFIQKQLNDIRVRARQSKEFRDRKIVGKNVNQHHQSRLSPQAIILNCLKRTPLGANEELWDLIYDLFMSYFGVGTYGTPLTHDLIQGRIKESKKFMINQHQTTGTFVFSS